MKKNNETVVYSPVEFKYTLPMFFHDETIYDEIQRKNWHEEIEFLFAKEGSGEVILDSESITINQGEFCAIEPYTVHNAKSITGLHFYNVGINSEFCKFNGIKIEDYKFEKVFDDKIAAEKLNTLHHRYFSHKSHPLYNAELCNALLGFILYIIKNHATYVPAVQNQKNIFLAIGYIKSNLTKKMTVDEICLQSGLSKYHFSREFKKITGYTVVDYINKLRCKKACRYLNANYSVKDVFSMFSFDNYSYFSRVFKKHIGISPTEYKKNSNSAKM